MREKLELLAGHLKDAWIAMRLHETPNASIHTPSDEEFLSMARYISTRVNISYAYETPYYTLRDAVKSALDDFPDPVGLTLRTASVEPFISVAKCLCTALELAGMQV